MVEMNASCSVGVGLDALPPEVWELILDKLKTTQDIQNCSQVCRLFHHLLERRKTHLGFGLVLPLILPWLGLKEALNCRLVCQDWKALLDKLVENSPLNRPYNGEEHDTHPLLNITGDIPRHPLQNLVKPVILYNEGSVRTLHQKLQAHPQCKVIGGSFSIGCQQVGNDLRSELYWRYFHLFSTSFGTQISSLSLIDVYTEDLENLDLQYLYIRMILENCPNLRKLHLDFEPILDDDDDEEAQMESFLSVAYPLPNMPQLESILLENEITTRLKLTLLDKYGEQLKWLGCTLCSSIPDAVLQKMGVITELAVRVNNTDTVDSNVAYCDAILRKLLLIPSRQLEKLVVQIGPAFCFRTEGTGTGLGLSLTTLLRISRTFALKILRVEGGSVHLKLEESECPLALRQRVSSLKVLEFFDTVGVPSFNFIECFPSLEQLVVKAHYPVTLVSPRIPPNQLVATLPILAQLVRMNNQKIAEKFNLRNNLYKGMAGEKAIYQTTIWKEMKHLKSIHFYFSHNRVYVSDHGVLTTVKKTFTRNDFWNHAGF